MKPLTLSLASILALCSCTGPGGQFDPVPIVSAGVTYKAARIAEKRPSRIGDLHAAATALDDLAAGVVNRETVMTALRRFLSDSDAEERALVALVAGYFPSGDAAIPVNEKLSALCRTVAGAIRMGLPSK